MVWNTVKDNASNKAKGTAIARTDRPVTSCPAVSDTHSTMMSWG